MLLGNNISDQSHNSSQTPHEKKVPARTSSQPRVARIKKCHLTILFSVFCIIILIEAEMQVSQRKPKRRECENIKGTRVLWCFFLVPNRTRGEAGTYVLLVVVKAS